MKNSNLKTLALATVAAVGLSCFAADAAEVSLNPNSRFARQLSTVKPVREFRGQKPWGVPADGSSRTAMRKAKGSDASHQFPALNFFDYLEGPDGTTWFYTAEYDYLEIEYSEYYTDYQIQAFTFYIYDSNFNLVGTIKDDVEFLAGETRAASVSLDPCLTRKFFNVDDKLEVMVYFAMNTNSYNVHYYNKVYQLDGEKKGDKDVAIAKIEGRCVDTVNRATDAFSEDFYLTFVQDITPNLSDFMDSLVDYVNNYKTKLITYTKAGWDTTFHPVFEYEIYNTRMPGDTTDGIYFISKVKDGKLYLVYSMYEKPYFVDPAGESLFETGELDESATPDNHFLIEVYALDGSSTPALVSKTVVPVEFRSSTDTIDYTFYSIGSLAWQRDIDMDVNGTPDAPAFIVARDFTKANNLEVAETHFDIYDAEGNILRNIASNIEGVILLSDVPGLEPQALFTKYDIRGNYIYDFVDIYSAKTVLSVPQTIQGNAFDVVGDRVPDGKGSYKYAFELSSKQQDDNGNEILRVMWFNPDGTLDRIDDINAGPNVARAQINLTAYVLDPYLYDTDPAMEYAVLVDRYTMGMGDTNTKYEFVVVDDNGKHLAAFTEADEKGQPLNYTVIRNEDVNYIQMVYRYNNTRNTYAFNVDIHDLPLNMMAGGDGSKENPYKIATVADLQLVKVHPDAYYQIVNDIDASGFDFKAIANFSGALDGQNHRVNGLSISGKDNVALFSNTLTDGVNEVRNIVFINPVINLDDNSGFAGLIAGRAYDLTVDNVMSYNLKAESESFNSYFGGLVGFVSAGTTSVTNSAVLNAEINLPAAYTVGGIVGSARSGLDVKAASFSGKISGDANIGGIAGQLNGGNSVADCHVNAEIVGKNTIGGIAGSAARIPVTRNYVKGSLEATEAPLWGVGYSVGGVVGALEPDETASETLTVSHNVVALKSITVADADLEEDFDGQTASVHRIVGSSSLNTAESDLDEDWNYVYGDLHAEKGLALNYALASLAVVNENFDDDHASPEGASIERISREFLAETLGWKFGEDSENPWHKFSDADPWLHFESSVLFSSLEYIVEPEAEFNVAIHFFVNEEITLEQITSDFVCDYDSDIIEMTGDFDFADNTLTIGFKAGNEGSTDLTASALGYTAAAVVSVKEPDGVESAVVDNAAAISFDGSAVAAEGAFIEIFTTAGVRLAAAYDRVSVESLAKGVYVAVATTADGARSTLKIAL